MRKKNVKQENKSGKIRIFHTFFLQFVPCFFFMFQYKNADGIINELYFQFIIEIFPIFPDNK